MESRGIPCNPVEIRGIPCNPMGFLGRPFSLCLYTRAGSSFSPEASDPTRLPPKRENKKLIFEGETLNSLNPPFTKLPFGNTSYCFSWFLVAGGPATKQAALRVRVCG